MPHRMTLALLAALVATWLAVESRSAPRGARDPGPGQTAPSKTETSKGQMVIVVYRPHTGKEQALLELIRDHLRVLRGQGLATERASLVMRAADGALLEIFEWKSKAAVDEAHGNPVIQAMWQKFNDACEFAPLSSLEESKQLFAPFEAVDP